MNGHYTAREREHVGNIKALPCSVCDAPGPSEAHHIEQGMHFTVVAVCHSCHRDGFLGWHGQRRAWKVRKLDELGALNITLGRLL